MTDYAIVDPDERRGPLRRQRRAGRVPPHSDFEQGTGHFHDEIEELYIVGRGTLTMRFGDEVKRIAAPAVVRVAPQTRRSHRNEGDEPVELWAISRHQGNEDATKIDDFWPASSDAARHAGTA